MEPARAKRLAAYERRYRELQSKIARIGFIRRGSLVQRSTVCGKPGCRCQGTPPQLHGPYWQWSRSVNGKTLTRRLTEDEAKLYRRWIDNGKRLDALVAQMEELSEKAAAAVGKTSTSPVDRDRRARSSR